MPRRGAVIKRERTPDPVYNSDLVARFMNSIMKKGKKSIAEKVFYSAMDTISEKLKKDPIVVFNQALENVMPILEVRPEESVEPHIRSPARSARTEELLSESAGYLQMLVSVQEER